MHKAPKLIFIFDRFHDGRPASPGAIVEAEDIDHAVKAFEKLFPGDTWHAKSYINANDDDE